MAINKAKMKCNAPKRQVQGGKKFVVKACKGGKSKIIRYGDANMKIRKSNPALERVLELGIVVQLQQINLLLVIGRAKNGKEENLVS